MKNQTRIMGILNVTPDSFSDGGCWQTEEALEARIEQLLAEGADMIDVGGASSRPFSRPVPVEEELARVLPAIRKIRALSASVPISVDTTRALVARESLAAGADIINDISALSDDPEMIAVCRQYEGPVIIMHMQGQPGVMQVNPVYRDVVEEINVFLGERIAWMEERGVERGRIVVDPGLGFGKNLSHNLEILRNLESFKRHGCPLLIGHSRKAFLGEILDLPVESRDYPTAMVSAFCARQGTDILRVHNVRASRQALTLSSCLEEAKELACGQ